MSDPHPNLILLERLSKHFPHNLDGAGDLFDESFVWHYFNPHIPQLAGDYRGLEGVGQFFGKLGALTRGTFRITDTRVVDIGDELIVTAAKIGLEVDGQPVDTDSLLIWRVVENKFAEAWDIPAVNTVRPHKPG